MSNIRWLKLSVSLILCMGCMLGLVGCSESVSSEPDMDWTQNESNAEFERQADRPPATRWLWWATTLPENDGSSTIRRSARRESRSMTFRLWISCGTRGGTRASPRAPPGRSS